MLRRKTKLRWLVPFLLLGVAGCAKVEMPRASKAAAAAALGVPSSVAGSGYLSEFDKVCSELPGMSDVPLLVSVEEYAQLIDFVKTASPLLSSDKDRFTRAHVHALKSSNEAVMMLLEKNQKSRELQSFKNNLVRFVHYNHPNPAADLQQMVTRVMEISETGKCAGAYLAHFYSDFIRELDAYGDIAFGLTENKSPEDTLLSQPVLPDETRNALPTRLQGTVMIATLPKLLRSPVLDLALRTLEQGFAQQTYRVILFDLRYSGGVELPLLAQIRASAGRGWGAQPVVFFINRQTRGVAALLTQQLGTHPNVLVIGEDDETYGYGRKLTQQSAVLAPGLSPLTLTIGSEYLQPPGLASDSDGYRIHLDHDHVMVRSKSSRDKDKSLLDLAIERADQWSTQAPPGDFGQTVVQTDPNNVGPDGQPIATNLSETPAPPSGQQAAGQAVAGDAPAQPGADPTQDPPGGSPPGTPLPPDPNAAAAAPAAAPPPPVTPPAGMPPATAMSTAAPTTF